MLLLPSLQLRIRAKLCSSNSLCSSLAPILICSLAPTFHFPPFPHHCSLISPLLQPISFDLVTSINIPHYILWKLQEWKRTNLSCLLPFSAPSGAGPSHKLHNVSFARMLEQASKLHTLAPNSAHRPNDPLSSVKNGHLKQMGTKTDWHVQDVGGCVWICR